MTTYSANIADPFSAPFFWYNRTVHLSGIACLYVYYTMPILFFLFALFLPRVVIALLWIFSSWFAPVQSIVIGLAGFLFLPYTLLWYTAVENWYNGTWGPLQIVVLVLAVLADLGIPGRQYKRASA